MDVPYFTTVITIYKFKKRRKSALNKKKLLRNTIAI